MVRRVTDIGEEIRIPGTAQIRKITVHLSPMELLETAAVLAEGGYDRKLFSVLSRVYMEKKGFGKKYEEGMDDPVRRIIASSVPAELKMQSFTSFELPDKYRPDAATVKGWFASCPENRQNIAGYFIGAYGYEKECYREIIENRNLFKSYAAVASGDSVMSMFEEILEKENKEYITGVIRLVRSVGRRYSYRDKERVAKVTAKVFESREVFYTSKILYCLAFTVPAENLPSSKELYKILKISINYEEKTIRSFVKKYHSDFNMSDEAMCGYFVNNKKSSQEKPLVEKFAAHLVLLDDQDKKNKLLRTAFKRGGKFRMYAGCMQDGRVDEEKQKRFHYTEEDIAWVKTLPGLKEK